MILFSLTYHMGDTDKARWNFQTFKTWVGVKYLKIFIQIIVFSLTYLMGDTDKARWNFQTFKTWSFTSTHTMKNRTAYLACRLIFHRVILCYRNTLLQRRASKKFYRNINQFNWMVSCGGVFQKAFSTLIPTDQNGQLAPATQVDNSWIDTSSHNRAGQ